MCASWGSQSRCITGLSKEMTKARGEKLSIGGRNEADNDLLCASIQRVGAGSNKNQNKLIRRFVLKGTDIGKLEQADVERIQGWMNRYT